MARPVKKGLEYFNIDCNQEDNLSYVEAKHGISGYGIVVKLWKKIYTINGYYTDWFEKNITLFSREINVDEKTIADVVETCFEEGIFSREIFDKYKVLTSRGIQKRYYKIVTEARRKDCEIKPEYSLLIVNAALMQEKHGLMSEETIAGPALITSFSTQSKVKESKVKESKESNTRADEFSDEQLLQENFSTTDEQKEIPPGSAPPPFDLTKSNLFRQPSIPTKEQVIEVFVNQGGTEEMAVSFFEKNESTAWFNKGSPITNFANLVPSFIRNWKENEKHNGKRNIKNAGRITEPVPEGGFGKF